MTQIDEEIHKMHSPFFNLRTKRYAPSTSIKIPIFTKKEINDIKLMGNICLQKQNIKATINNQTIDNNYRVCDVAWLYVNKVTVPIYNKISEAIHLVNKELFNYEISVLESLQFTKYESTSQGFYKKHIDMANGDGPPDCRKLSFSVQLSDPTEYSGGDLLFYYNENPEIADKKLGVITVFSSYVLHEVTPVTKGTRYSLVGWVRGPSFK